MPTASSTEPIARETENQRFAGRLPTSGSALKRTGDFLEQSWKRVVAISVAVVIPCFWHRTIAASDLGSHLYNAWLAHLIERKQAPGLWLAHQWTNVLFDGMLTICQHFVGFALTEKICVSTAVLIFFWGLFTLTSASSRSAPWYLVPFMALVSYGYTFEMGFFNYYLSLGLAFWALALLWRGNWREKVLAITLCPLIAIAHPFGLLWLAGIAAYIGLVERARGWWKLLALPLAAGAVIFVHYYFWHHFIVEAEPERWYRFTGADQLLLFGPSYLIPEFLLITFVVVAVGIDVIRRIVGRESMKSLLLPLQLYIVAELAVVFFPRGVTFAGRVPIALITERLTTISAAMACLVLASIRPSKWHLGGLLAIVAIFFTLLHTDTGAINQMEWQAGRLVRTAPTGSRVMATIYPQPHSRVLVQHIIDRACVGYCFDYGNYEPGSEVFRVRATNGNPYVLPDYKRAIDTEHGRYVVQPEDLPLYQVYQCSADGRELCIRPLHAGELNDHAGIYNPDP